MWLDSHCHLTADKFDPDRAEVIVRARQAGVTSMIAIGSGYGSEGNEAAIALARREPDVFATVGVHPHDASQFDAGVLDRLRAWLEDERVVAVGECGLDYHYMNSDREAQRRAFAAQVGRVMAYDLAESMLEQVKILATSPDRSVPSLAARSGDA